MPMEQPPEPEAPARPVATPPRRSTLPDDACTSSGAPHSGRRARYVGTLRKHMETQTDTTELVELRKLNGVVTAAQDELSELQQQIMLAQDGERREHKQRLEEKLAQQKEHSGQRIASLEAAYETKLQCARTAGEVERAQLLTKLRAERGEAILNLTLEFEERYATETRQLKQTASEYKTLNEEQSSVLVLLREQVDELQRMLGKDLKAKDELQSVKDELSGRQTVVDAQRSQLRQARARVQALEAESKRQRLRAETAERAHRDTGAQAKAERENSSRQLSELARGKEMADVRMKAEAEATLGELRATQNELRKERHLRTIISERQSEAIGRVVAENTALKEQLQRVLRNTRPGRGTWVESGHEGADGEAELRFESLPSHPREGEHSGRDLVGFSTTWRTCTAVTAREQRLRRPMPPVAVRGGAPMSARAGGQRAHAVG